ncbi:unnamed protein product [Heligmosomoides polygyrus]|uniref:Uncharacterized protein n=1 Tax=Heligmosomoides polygyrus TaxID=6339 RepID=A0A3P7Y1L2_HELPZ|nr:unnamed protein product [Heligmosomoides polygyrus]
MRRGILCSATCKHLRRRSATTVGETWIQGEHLQLQGQFGHTETGSRCGRRARSSS